MKISCPNCNDVLDVGNEHRAVVAICSPLGKAVACPGKLWGDARTRVDYADPDDREQRVTHVLQLNPPNEGLERFVRPAPEPFSVGDYRGPGITHYED